MYKRASRAMQHAHRVDTIDPSKGFVFREADPDYMPSASNLGEKECLAEIAQLSVELTHTTTALAIAEREGDREQAAFLGKKIFTLTTRRGPLRDRLNALKMESASQVLGDVVKEMVPPDLAKQIFDECRRRMSEKVYTA